jgi:tagatose-6-phosphate ketose/aldose isomerase
MENALTVLMGMSSKEKLSKGIAKTPQEIYNQVDLLSNTFERFSQQKEKLAGFLRRFLQQPRRIAMCTGAGTSEFIGYCLESLMRKKLCIPVNVISTPRIVTTPQDFFIQGYATLLLSFARSGNSPESLGAVRIADMLSPSVYHMVITCNRHGALFKKIHGRPNAVTLVLDDKTNDRGLAMTSSFSNLLMAGQMFSHLDCFEQYKSQSENLLQACRALRDKAPDVAQEISEIGFERAVFLGDGANLGTAIESHLKLQELTAGQVMCCWDTFPGLRHGPEAVIDSNTLVVAFLSADGYTRMYELDLLREIREKKIGKALLTVSHTVPEEIKKLSDYTIEYGPQADIVSDDLVPLVYIIVGQLLGLFASLQRGLQPDKPSESGIINRVVEGVRVYDPVEYRTSGRTQVIAER